MSPSATPATQSGAASARDQRCPSGAQGRRRNQPSVKSAAHATQSEGGCREVPRLPCKTKVDVAKSHACHAKPRWISGSARLPCKVKVDVAKPNACHAKCRGITARTTAPKRRPSVPPEPAQCRKCHAKGRWMSPSATPARQSEGGCREGPRLPRKVKVYVWVTKSWVTKGGLTKRVCD